MARSASEDATALAAVIETPFPGGERLGLAFEGARLRAVDFRPAGTALHRSDNPLVQEAVRQFEAYFADPRMAFALPLVPAATPFQEAVRAALCAIPPGQTRTYGEVARAVASAPRAVGGGCRANPVPLVVPCHRVVAAGGRGGFAGEREGPALAIKRWLLRHEGARSD